LPAAYVNFCCYLTKVTRKYWVLLKSIS